MTSGCGGTRLPRRLLLASVASMVGAAGLPGAMGLVSAGLFLNFCWPGFHGHSLWYHSRGFLTAVPVDADRCHRSAGRKR
eukprot:3819236-Rhodomonas_salina.6